MNPTYPVSLDQFKMYFLREAGLEYQPFPSWEKTVWDTGDVCLENNVYYRSLVDLNHIAPSAPVTPNEMGQPSAYWEPLTVIYNEEEPEITAGTIVYYKGVYYKASIDTNTVPGTAGYWLQFNPALEYPDARPWVPPIAYNNGDKVIAVVNYKVSVWESMMDGNYFDPSAGANIPDQVPAYPAWEESDDDTEDLSNVILDADILRAMGEAVFKFNPRLFDKDRGATIFLYLTMFFLVYDRQMAASGMNGNSAAGPVIHRTVGKMSVSYAESKLFKNYPSYEFLSSNDYGRKAFNLMMPYLRGGIRILRGMATGE